MRNLTFLVFVALTFLCWGTYGPTLHLGQSGMGADGKLSLLRPIICVGIAYFLIAVLFPVIVLVTKGEQGRWSISGFWWSFIAGALGAFGALGITLAFKFDGSPIFVMPLVFGCAPIMNTLVTMVMAKTYRQASLLFFVGIAMVALGAAGVLLNKPSPQKQPASQSSIERVVPPLRAAQLSLPESDVLNVRIAGKPVQEGEFGSEQDSASGKENSEQATSTPTPEPEAMQDSLSLPATPAPDANDSMPLVNESRQSAALGPLGMASNWFMVILGIVITAVCWGAYGPILHKGQAKMAGSRLRPFLCVGLAYFAIAVVIPFWALMNYPEPGAWLTSSGWISRGAIWSLIAGALGAFGALGIIYAFNFGGKPIFVMPLVFGFAPVINTLVETTSKGLLSEIKPFFYPSLALVIMGAVMVLIFAPKSTPAKP